LVAHPIAIALTAMSWQEGDPLRVPVMRFRAAAVALLAAAVLVTIQPAPPAASAAEPALAVSSFHLSPIARVVALARSHLNAPYRWGAQGPRFFDCSGLVLRVFSQAGLASKVGGWANRSAYAMYAWFKRRGLASRTNGQAGDLVVWGGGAHVGIYLGHGKAISALTQGVRIHGIYALTNRFTAFLHTGLSVANVASIVKSAGSGAVGTIRHVTSAATLRIGAGTSYRRLALLARGTRLTVLGHRSDSHHRTWYRVKTPSGRTGWIAGWLTS
jgi:NlpC/P60 family/Bacterial SH3 domain